MSNQNVLTKLNLFLKTNNGQTTFSILGALFHSFIFGSIAALCIFAVLAQTTSINWFVILFVSIPLGWGGIFVCSYYILKHEAKKLAEPHPMVQKASEE
tara:strand:+ start:11711 stop:12007 length:297 start_codon:yes stop_codon:yes gene_type:complete